MTIKEYHEEDFIQLSALQHYIFCPRQCYLIHKEAIWCDNFLTTAGDIMHRKVDSKESEYIAPGVRQVCSLLLSSTRLGLSGRADLVEFNEKLNQVYPVEYKLGKPKQNDSDKIQLCAQMFCLEEMLNVDIPFGAIYYGRTHRRTVVDFTVELRQKCQETSFAVHALLEEEHPPKAINDRQCQSCSLKELCLPQLCSLKTTSKYIENFMED